MEIIHIAAELAPIAKVGGLGDVLHGLSRALLNKNHRVKILLPKYDILDLNWVQHLEVIETNHTVRFDGALYENTLWQGVVDGIPVIFVESHGPQNFFNRGMVYGCPDDISRFLYFCLAALEYVLKESCDVVHLHDWHTAAIAGLLKEIYPDKEIKTVFTIHNFSYQGMCGREDLERVGWEASALKEGDHYNLLKGGVIFADHVTTVSPSYARELLTSEISGPLQTTLKKYQHKFSGILNGIDYGYWNPKTDPLLPYHYSTSDLANKQKVKNALKKKLSLADEDSPLVGAVTRLVWQKGPEFIKAALLRTLEWGGQFVLLGSALDERTQSQFYNLKQKLGGCPHVHLELSYNEELSHLVFAASDLFLVPSRFEPCGLTQMIAMRYGTLPLARETGGLMDTVFDGKNGFTFGPPTIEAFNETLDRALETWYTNPDHWQKMVEKGMQTDFSWDHPAEAYLKVYHQL